MLYWAIIGSGDVVKRLVGKSFIVPKKSKVKYIFSHDLRQAKKLTKKYNFGKVVKNVNVIAHTLRPCNLLCEMLSTFLLLNLFRLSITKGLNTY